MPISVTITSPTQGATVGQNFTATGNVTGVSGPFPTPPPLKVRIEINGNKYPGTVTLTDSGSWTATFIGVPPGTDGVIVATWTPGGPSTNVDGIRVQ
jgi:hypothetical protein